MTNIAKFFIAALLLAAPNLIFAAKDSTEKSFPYDTSKLPNSIDWEVFKNGQAHEVIVYEVKSGDTLGKIAKKFKTTSALIRKLNDLSGENIHIGQKLKVWNSPFTVLVLKSRNLLVLKADKRILRAYIVSTGKAETATPAGTYTIKLKLVDPIWYHNGKAYQPGDPENGLGTRWMGFDLDSYGIHGTIHPDQIGQSVSSGCVRMHNEDAEELFDLIPEGTKVVIN